MSRAKRAALAALLAAGLAGVPGVAQAAPKCAEDEPCWVWSTDGNRKRGVVLTDGRRAVVGPCRFARLDRRHRIDWQRTARLRGDHTARKACR